jgi:hypothetical protein
MPNWQLTDSAVQATGLLIFDKRYLLVLKLFLHLILSSQHNLSVNNMVPRSEDDRQEVLPAYFI